MRVDLETTMFFSILSCVWIRINEAEGKRA